VSVSALTAQAPQAASAVKKVGVFVAPFTAESKCKYAGCLLNLFCELQAPKVQAIMKSQHAVALLLCLLQLTALNARVLSQGMSPLYDFISKSFSA